MLMEKRIEESNIDRVHMTYLDVTPAFLMIAIARFELLLERHH